MFEELALNVRAEGIRSDAEHLQCNGSPILIDDNDFVHDQLFFGPFDPKRRSRLGFAAIAGPPNATSFDRNAAAQRGSGTRKILLNQIGKGRCGTTGQARDPPAATVEPATPRLATDINSLAA